MRRLGKPIHWLLVFSGLLVALLVVLDRAAPAGRAMVKIAGADPVAYYGYARSLLFDGDFDLTNEYDALSLSVARDNYLGVVQETGRPGAPFPIGFPLLEIPFLALGHVTTWIFHGKSDGYSRTCMTFYFLGLIVFVTVGLLALFPLLSQVARELGEEARRAEWVALLFVFALFGSTTLLYYTFTPMAHAAEFMTASLFLAGYYRLKDDDGARIGPWGLVGASFGLMVLCRWQTALLAVVPLGYELSRWWTRPAKRGPWLLSRGLACATALVLFIPQMIAWRRVYGYYLVIPQGPEFFRFPPMHALHVLFSTQHGWFIWTPVTLLGVLGLVIRARRDPGLAIPLVVAILVEVLFIGSLEHAWAGHDAFGIRMLTCCLPMVFVGLVELYYASLAISPRIVPMTVALSAAFTLLSAVQFRLDLIPREDELTVSELIVDKLFLATTLRRHRIARHAAKLVAEDRPTEAIALLGTTAASLGEDRTLLATLVEACVRAEDTACEQRAAERLRLLLAKRLF